MLWLLLLVVALSLWSWLLIHPHKYWTKKGVKQGNPSFIFGESVGPFLGKQSFAEMVEMIYNMFPKDRYSGFYQFSLPTLVIRDPDLIKKITVKDFDHFTDHRSLIPEDCDPLWHKNLFALTGEKWRKMRATLSPAFTSNKMKFMFSLVLHRGENFAKHFLAQKEEIITLDVKDAFTRFTNDVIASTAFGIECDSLRERNNEFYLMGKEATDITGFKKTLKIFAYSLAPSVSKALKISFFSQEVVNFFTTLIKTNIESREKNKVVRPDMIHLLLEARKTRFKSEESKPVQDPATVEESETGKNRKAEITDEDIMSQALIFFFAGFDSVSSVMSFMAHELATNPEVQEKLTHEVDETLELCNGKLTYEALLAMKYIDMVVSEALRKWPFPIAVDRVCTKPYTIEPEGLGEKAVLLEKGSVLWIPTFGLHRDPRYYPDPERFDPERFSEENKNKIKSYTFLPFGSGPRNCIGSRFGLLEIKILFFCILAHFQFVPVEKTQIPLKLTKKEFNLVPENGFWLGLKRRVI